MRLLRAMVAAALLFATPTVSPVCAADAGELLFAIRAARGDSIPASATLSREAEARADEIVTDFSHDLWRGHYAEILAWNSYPEDVTEAAAVQQWLGSPDHRRILLGDYAYVGVGVADAEPKHFYVALFAKPRPEPTVRSVPSKGAAPAVLPNTDTEGLC